MGAEPKTDLSPKPDETPEEREARFAKMRKIVEQVPGATVFREGMKVPGQEEREEAESEWQRGEFDPVGDLAVTGMRLKRGEGRSAELATGPQCGEWDDVFITLRGSPVAGTQDVFFMPSGSEAALANRPETKWLVELSNPKLDDYWRKSFRAMSRGDLCRFKCAAKKSQAWLQSLADCCSSLGGQDRDGARGEADTRLTDPTDRVQVGTSGRDVVVELTLDQWLPVKKLEKKGRPTLYKRVLQHAPSALEMARKTKEEQLNEQLRYAGEGTKGRDDDEEEEVSAEPSRREARPPDRVRVTYSLRKSLGLAGFQPLRLRRAREQDTLEFNLGGGMGLSSGAFRAVEECTMRLEEGERASFTFVASEAVLPLSKSPLAGQGVEAGDTVELEIELEHLLKQRDVSREKDLSLTKCKLATGQGFWKPRYGYKVRLSAARAPKVAGRHSEQSGRRPPSGVRSLEVTLDDALLPPVADMLYSMSKDEVAIFTTLASKLEDADEGGGSDGGGGLFAGAVASDDGTASVWVRLDGMTRVEEYAGGAMRKETLNDEDMQWLEKVFVETKGEMPMLEEDVLVEMSLEARDGAGVMLFPRDRKLAFRTGDLPLCEDHMLIMFMSMYHGERAIVRASGEVAGGLIKALCQMRRESGGCQVDASSAARHVADAGLELSITILNHEPPEPKDGVSGEALLRTAEGLKERANRLLTAGYTAGAMRKYVRATWLMQDGKHKEDPLAPMTDVVGVAKGDPDDGPPKCRFAASQATAVKALRVSLHLNLAAGALKLSENYGALAAARVARELEPDAVKPMYREAQALVALQDYDEAIATLTRLIRVEPSNTAARKLLTSAKGAKAELRRKETATFSGLFSRAQREGPLYSKAEIERQRQSELLKTKYVADRAEERRRGVQYLDVQAMGRLPEDLRQKEVDSMNESIENDDRHSKVPEGMTEEQFKRVLQMRTDGVKEEKVRAELLRMKREEMQKAREHMTRAELDRMNERQQALERDRYKSDEVVAQREGELWEEFGEIKKRIEYRIPLYESEQRRQREMAEETQKVLEDENAEEEDKARAMRKLLHDPFKDLDAFLSDAEMYELNELKSKPQVPATQEALQKLLAVATERRIEAKIDELLDKEDDVLV